MSLYSVTLSYTSKPYVGMIRSGNTVVAAISEHTVL